MGRHSEDARPESIDLGSDAFHDYMFGATGEAGVRPHMIMFNSTGTHAVLSFVASGHVLFIDTRTRQPVGVFDFDPQAHAAYPSPDDRYVIVANQNGKMLHRIFTDYETNTFTLDPVALNLAPLEGPGRPNNRPICPIVTSDSRFTFVTLAGGGMFVVHTDPAFPMTIVNDYTDSVVHHDGCGGIELNGKMYINAGGAGHHDLYAFDLSDFDSTPDPTNSHAPTLIYSQDADPTTTPADAHGATLTKHGRYLWMADRWANKIVVVDTRTDSVVNEIPLAGDMSSDPAPDLLVTSPGGNRVFATLRGPTPLSGNNPAFNNAVGSTPGVGVIKVTAGGRSGKFLAIAPISHVVGGAERADPHGIALLTKVCARGDASESVSAAQSSAPARSPVSGESLMLGRGAGETVRPGKRTPPRDVPFAAAAMPPWTVFPPMWLSTSPEAPAPAIRTMPDFSWMSAPRNATRSLSIDRHCEKCATGMVHETPFVG
jgi:DNA-binding beta-propeller fold protein YncE